MASSAESAVGVSGYVESIKREKDRFVRLAFCAADMLLEVDDRYVITFAAGASQSLIGSAPETLLGKPLIDLVVPEDVLFVTEVLKGIAPGSRLDPIPIRLKRTTASTLRVSLTGYRLPEKPGNYLFAIRMGSPPVVADTVKEGQLDPESGLLKKEAFADFAGKHIRAAGDLGKTLKLTMLHSEDLADMRTRIDPEAAKIAIRTMSACLKANADGGEAAGQLEDGAYGFLHKPDLDIEKITNRVVQIFQAADPTGVGISVNANTVTADVGDISEGDAARVLLYTVNQFCQAREIGDNKFEMSSLAENLKTMTREATEKLENFRVIVSEGQFDIAFQPIVALDTGAIHHYEALVRFEKRLDRSPYELITFAEQMGVISDFDLAITKRVLKWLAVQNKSGARHVVAVNLSGQSVANTGLVTALHDLLQQSDVPSSQLIFEITESSRIDDLDGTNRFIQSLRKAGHEVCLDDFGAGSAALRYLHALEVDIIKIDGQYVRGAMKTPRNQSFLKAIAGLCHDLGTETIAEMVEDEPCAAMLRACQVRFGQGYLFGKPSFEVGDVSPTTAIKSFLRLPSRRPEQGGSRTTLSSRPIFKKQPRPAPSR